MLACDTHVHSYRSFVGDANMTFRHIGASAAELSIDVVVIADHLMKSEDVENLKRTREELLEFRSSNRAPALLFGVEVCEIAPDGSTLLSPQLVDQMRFEVVIGGVHETHMPRGASLQDMTRMQHRHHIMMMENPLIDILVHPWWLDFDEFDRLCIEWPADMSFIPDSLTVELAEASRRTGTYIEISTMSGLCNRQTSYRFKEDLMAYYRLLNREGALFAIGTDAHELSEMSTFSAATDLIRTIGIDKDRIWQPVNQFARLDGEIK